MKIRTVLKHMLFFGLVLVVTGLALHVLGSMDARLGPLDLGLRIQWATHGETRIILPPMGEVDAATHRWPVAISVQLDRLDPELLHMDFSRYGKPANYLTNFLPEIRRIILLFAFRLLLIGAFAAGLTGLALWGWRDWKRWGISLLLGLVFTGSMIFGVSSDYNRKAFATPRYEGMLETAPWLLGLLDEGMSEIDTLGRRLEAVAGNLNRMFNQVDQLAPLARADGELKVVHVSDIHNNPAAYEFMARVVKGFGADLIVDTGDITDFGTPLEAHMTEKLAGLHVPYVFIPGNHDSPKVVAHIRTIPGVTVLDGRAETFKGLTILGLGDPASHYGKLMPTPAELRQSATELLALWQKMPVPPDIVAVHNVKTAQELLGKVPVLLHGHDHQAKIYSVGKGWVIDAGSTGAAGIRGLENESKEGDPYSLAILRYDRAPASSGHAYELTAVDLIKVYSLNGRFVLERKVLKGGGGDQTFSSGLALPRTAGERDGAGRPVAIK